MEKLKVVFQSQGVAALDFYQKLIKLAQEKGIEFPAYRAKEGNHEVVFTLARGMDPENMAREICLLAKQSDGVVIGEISAC